MTEPDLRFLFVFCKKNILNLKVSVPRPLQNSKKLEFKEVRGVGGESRGGRSRGKSLKW